MSQPAPTRRIAVFLNARAASDQALGRAIEQVRGRGHPVRCVFLSAPGDAWREARAAGRDGFALIAAGGDGTLNEVVNGAADSGAPAVGVLPFGTANDFATCIGMTNLSAEGALFLFAEGAPVPIDVGLCNGRHFINVASGGFGAEVTASTSPTLKELLGGLAYTVAGAVKLLTDEQRQVRLRTPAGEWAGPLLLFSVGNSRSAGGYAVAPKARLDDGLLDLAIVPWAEVFDVPDLVEDLFAETLREGRMVRYEQTPWLEAEARGQLHVNLDGEPMLGTSFRIEIQPRRLPFFLPDDARRLLTAAPAPGSPPPSLGK